MVFVCIMKSMDANDKKILQMRVKRTIEALGKNHMQATYVPEIKDVVPMVRALMAKGSSCAVGGSISLFESGVIDLLQSGDYDFKNRYAAKTPEEIKASQYAAFTVDTFLASANAVTEHGELYLVDGRGTRIAPIIFGPKQVILICSTDKIVPDLHAAVVRVKEEAAPANVIRLGGQSACAKLGRCMRPTCDDRNLMALPAGACEHTVCRDYLVLSNQMEPNRIKVLFVPEKIGY